jgi:Sec-independent protein translocase protein TatA
MDVEELDSDSEMMNSLDEMSDKELAEAYTQLSKAVGMLSSTLNKIEADYEEKKRRNDVSDSVLQKSKENANEAEERQQELDNMLDVVTDEVEKRDINPYELI